MDHIGQTRRRLVTTAHTAVIVAVLAAMPGCGGGSQPSAEAAPAGHHDPGQVCAGFATDRAAHDTTTDTGPEDAHERARRWLHPDLAGQRPPPGRHGQWTRWTAHQVVVAVQVEAWAGDGLPTDTDQVAYRAVLVSATPVGAYGWSGPTGRHTGYCTLGRFGHGWLITGYHLDGLG